MCSCGTALRVAQRVAFQRGQRQGRCGGGRGGGPNVCGARTLAIANDVTKRCGIRWQWARLPTRALVGAGWTQHSWCLAQVCVR